MNFYILLFDLINNYKCINIKWKAYWINEYSKNIEVYTLW